MLPKKFKAKTLTGSIVVGWFVELHLPIFDDVFHDKIIGYETVHSIFSDLDRSSSYWHTILLDTLEEVPEQLNLF